MPLEIVRNNIVDMEVDAIVNTANPMPVVGTGVDRAVHEKAGPALLEARKVIGTIVPGQSAITPAFQLGAKYVIHTVGPIWYGGDWGEEAVLKSCYETAFDLAESHGCQSVAFPLLSAGNYKVPKDVALQAAISAISAKLLKSDMMVYLVVFDRSAYALSEKLFKDIKSYIDENLVSEIHQWEHGGAHGRAFRRMEEERKCKPRRLEDLISQVGETFSEALIRMIDEKGLKDPDVYRRANISRQHFSKIKNNKDYQPKKTTALAFAVALRLNLDETKDLLGKAGYILTKSSQLDMIVQFFIEQKNYDIFIINENLYGITGQILGS